MNELAGMGRACGEGGNDVRAKSDDFLISLALEFRRVLIKISILKILNFGNRGLSCLLKSQSLVLVLPDLLLKLRDLLELPDSVLRRVIRFGTRVAGFGTRDTRNGTCGTRFGTSYQNC